MRRANVRRYSLHVFSESSCDAIIYDVTDSTRLALRPSSRETIVRAFAPYGEGAAAETGAPAVRRARPCEWPLRFARSGAK